MNKLCLEALGDKKRKSSISFFCNDRVIKDADAGGNGRGRLKQHSNTNGVLESMLEKPRRAGSHLAVNLGSVS